MALQQQRHLALLRGCLGDRGPEGRVPCVAASQSVQTDGDAAAGPSYPRVRIEMRRSLALDAAHEIAYTERKAIDKKNL